MTIDEIKKWMLESSGFPVTQANAEYLERFQAIAFKAGAASRDAEIKRLKVVIHMNLETYRKAAANLREERDQLRAQINSLREAIEKIMSQESDNGSILSAGNCAEIAYEALASTPEQYLAEYRNNVIEKCDSVCDKRSMRKNDGNWTDFEWDSICGTNELAADEIRAMKEQP